MMYNVFAYLFHETIHAFVISQLVSNFFQEGTRSFFCLINRFLHTILERKSRVCRVWQDIRLTTSEGNLKSMFFLIRLEI